MMQFATLLAFLSTFALGSNGLTLKGSPSRVDTIVLDSSSEALLAELSGVTVLDTGLTILPGVCDVTDAATKLAGTFAQLREIRGTVSATSASCLDMKAIFGKLAVVRADGVADDEATGIILTGIATSDLPTSLTVVGGNGGVTVDGSVFTLPPSSSCSASCSAGCVDGSTADDCCPAECAGGCDSDGRCHACADGKLHAPDGSCGSSCPTNTLSYGFRIHNIDTWAFDSSGACKGSRIAAGTGGGGWGRVDSRRYCIAACPDDTFESDGECVAHCPGMARADEVTRKCPSGFAGTVCDTHFDIEVTSDDAYGYGYAYESGDDSFYADDDGSDHYMNSSYGFRHVLVKSLCHVEVLQGLGDCQVFHGGIDLNKLSAGISQDAMVEAFESVTVVTGYVQMYQQLFTSLDFLANVVSIGKCDEDPATPEPRCKHVSLVNGKYAIKLTENNYMNSLSLKQLRRIGGPGDHAPVSPIYIKDNEGLCLTDKIDWSDLSEASFPVGKVGGGTLEDNVCTPPGQCKDPSSATEEACEAAGFTWLYSPNTMCKDDSSATEEACEAAGFTWLYSPNTMSDPCQLGFTISFMNSARSKLSIEGFSPAIREQFYTSPVHPVTCATKEKKCAALCGDRGCWDFSEYGCQLCADVDDVLREGTCISGGCESGDPSPGFFEVPEAPGVCKGCHESCDDCTGDTEKDCTKCVGDLVLLKSGQCGSECPKGQYPDDSRVCKDCREECTECEGYDQCTACDVTQKWYLNFPASTKQCVSPTACPAGTYPADNTALCTECDESCGTCDAGGPASCLSCAGDYPIFFTETRRCYTECPGSAYTDYTDPNNLACGICNANCAKCFGKESTQCLECADNTLTADVFPDRSVNAAAIECYNAAECPVGKYADFSTERCESCTADCHTCSGAKMFNALFCTRCQNTKLLNPVDWDCVTTCPAEHFSVVPEVIKLEGADSICEECTQCTDGTAGDGSVQQYSTTDCTHTSDRACAPCTICTFPAEFYITRCSDPNAASGRDAECGQVKSECSVGYFQTAEPTEDQDRQCQRLTTCNEINQREYESVAATSSTDRVCLRTTACTMGKQYENTSWTRLSDRQCDDLTDCNQVLQYQSEPETETADRVCSSLTVCQGALDRVSDGEYESQAPSLFADRGCSACDTCPEGQERIAGCDGKLNSQCGFKDLCGSADFNPCVHEYSDEGLCNTINGTARVCTCPDGFRNDELDDCNIRESVCVADVTCGSNERGTCIPEGLEDDDYVCDCAEGFSGDNCEIRDSVCDQQNVCQNGAICTSTGLQDRDFVCDCVGSWTGTNCQFDSTICEKEADLCTSNGYDKGRCYVDIPAGDARGEPTALCDCTPEDGTQAQTACGDLCDKVFDGTVCTEQRLDGSAMKQAENKIKATAGAVAGSLAFLALLAAVIALLFARKVVNKNAQYEAFKKGEAIPADEWEIVPRDLLTIGQQIGSGNFGLVNKGMYMDPNAEVDKTQTMFNAATDVAVKTLKLTDIDYGVMDGDNKVNLDDPRHRAAAKEFFDEMDLMKAIGNHQNVINLIGVCTQDRPYLIVLEFCGEGDLRGFMQKRRAKGGKQQQIDRDDMFSYAIQIANGMEHLSVDHRIVHRDLAARNVLVKKVGGVDIMKVSDFGLARDVYEADFYQKSSDGVMAIKWMSPEALTDRIFTTKGDVWSYGIVMWEISTLGYMPYPGYQNHEIEKCLEEGYRMPYPNTCAGKDYYSVTLKCWDYEEDLRPSFSQIKAELINMSGFKVRDLKKLLGEDFDPDALANEHGSEPGVYADVDNGGLAADQGDAYMEPSVRGSVDNSPEAAGSWGGEEESFQLGPASARGLSKRTSADLASFRPMTLLGAEHDQAVYDNSLPRSSNGMVAAAEQLYDDGNAGEMYDMADTGGPAAAGGGGGGGLSDGDPGQMYDMAQDDGAGGNNVPSNAGLMSDGDPGGMYDMAENNEDGTGVYDAGMPLSPSLTDWSSPPANGGRASQTFFGGVSDLAGRPSSAVYVETQLSDGNPGDMYDTADGDDGEQNIAEPMRVSSGQTEPGGIAEHSFGEVVSTNKRDSGVVTNKTYEAVNPKLMTTDETRIEMTTDEVGGTDMRAERAGTVWEPIDMDPKSKSFRLKSVRRSNPLITDSL